MHIAQRLFCFVGKKQRASFRTRPGALSGSSPLLSKTARRTGAALFLGSGLFGWWSSSVKEPDNPNLFPKAYKPPLIEELAELTFAPDVPPPIDRNHPIKLKVDMDVEVKNLSIDGVHDFEFWSFNGGVPGPFIRAREGDVIEVSLTNNDPNMLHNLDFHAVSGPGGGAVVLTTDSLWNINDVSGKTKQAYFRLDYPGLFIYHCAVAPVPLHMANGMYGLILVEPKQGLPKVDKEYYVLQSEFYTTDDPTPGSSLLGIDEQRLVDENPNYVVFNGADGSLRDAGALKANAGDRVRIYFGNAGPNLASSFHIIGAIMDQVYREGDLISPPSRGIQTTLVPAGGAAVIELDVPVPGTYALVDHSVSRFDKGAVGWLQVDGEPRPDIYHSMEPPRVCPRCTHHP